MRAAVDTTPKPAYTEWPWVLGPLCFNVDEEEE